MVPTQRLAAALLCAVGCVTPYSTAERVAEQAAIDFRCPADQISIEHVYAWRAEFIGASGCDSTGLYAVGARSVYAVGPRSPVMPRPVAAVVEEWPPGGGVTDPGPSDPRRRCDSPNVRACAAEHFGCSAESYALSDIGAGRWETHGCGQRALWMPTAHGWALDQ
jgi:hypothetical protein